MGEYHAKFWRATFVFMGVMFISICITPKDKETFGNYFGIMLGSFCLGFRDWVKEK
jgi:hypothetical protein